MTFSLTVLGCSSAIPTLTRNPSAHLLNVNERLFLIDCGEGTQLQLRRYHLHMQRLRHIFISHLHGDHFYGLIGLITTLHLLGRREELHLYAHPMLEEIINIQLKASQSTLLYPLYFHPLQQDQYEKVYEDDLISVHSFPVVHSVPTNGFIFREKLQDRKIRKDILEKMNIPVSVMPEIKKGEDFTDEQGHVHKNSTLTIDPPKPRSFAYCADTVYSESIIPFIQNCDLLYHEATFLQEKIAIAKEKWHSTTIDAASIAKKGHVKKLIIGHFSARYDDLKPLLDEARTVFPETDLAEDGAKFLI
jgi:ribonuclease Z